MSLLLCSLRSAISCKTFSPLLADEGIIIRVIILHYSVYYDVSDVIEYKSLSVIGLTVDHGSTSWYKLSDISSHKTFEVVKLTKVTEYTFNITTNVVLIIVSTTQLTEWLIILFLTNMKNIYMEEYVEMIRTNDSCGMSEFIWSPFNLFPSLKFRCFYADESRRWANCSGQRYVSINRECDIK